MVAATSGNVLIAEKCLPRYTDISEDFGSFTTGNNIFMHVDFGFSLGALLARKQVSSEDSN